MSQGTPADLVTPLLGSQSCSPLVGVRTNRCRECDGCGIVDTGRGVGDDIRTATCSSCDGTGLARTLQQLIEERRELLQEMRSCGGDVETRETLRAQVAVLDVEIAELRRSGRAA